VNPTYDFTGQVALVTGAGSGMGLAAVVLADVNATVVRTAADELSSAGHQANWLRCAARAAVPS
jgi:NAD(P)-dependent dehydrogenase (short-subunit alcohol dehydrogenase family)